MAARCLRRAAARRAPSSPSPRAGRAAGARHARARSRSPKARRPRPSAAWKTLSRWPPPTTRPILRVALENDVHLVHLEPGRIEFRPMPARPRTLAGDLQQKLRDWTGERWTVSIAISGGAPTLAEQKQSAKTARFEAVAQEPMVRAVLDRFPGAEIVAVRDTVTEDIAPAMPERSPTS